MTGRTVHGKTTALRTDTRAIILSNAGGVAFVRTAVVGHVEWVRFAKVERLPRQGEIVTASDSWVEPAGGGADAAGELVRLGAEVDFFLAVGNDALGQRAREALETLGCRVHAAVRDEPQRRAFTFVDADGERTITLMGAKLHPHGADPLPWGELAEVDAVYFCAGDAHALRAARQARVLVATARELPTLLEAQVPLDALVRSGQDPSEAYRPGQLDPEPGLIVTTMGREGGSFVAGAEEGVYAAAELPGPIVDAYGAGDSFAAGLTFALGGGDDPKTALGFATACGASALTRRGAHGPPLAPGP
jgi:ribokinase